jgi:hypothetical protein
MFRHQDEVLKDFKVTVKSDTVEELASPSVKASGVGCINTGIDILKDSERGV